MQSPLRHFLDAASSVSTVPSANGAQCVSLASSGRAVRLCVHIDSQLAVRLRVHIDSQLVARRRIVAPRSRAVRRCIVTPRPISARVRSRQLGTSSLPVGAAEAASAKSAQSDASAFLGTAAYVPLHSRCSLALRHFVDAAGSVSAAPSAHCVQCVSLVVRSHAVCRRIVTPCLVHVRVRSRQLGISSLPADAAKPAGAMSTQSNASALPVTTAYVSLHNSMQQLSMQPPPCPQ